MQVFTLITADILFLLLIVVGVVLERRLSRLEFERAEAESREKSAYFDLAFELDALTKRLDDMITPPEQSEDEILRAQTADKRFTEGVASILGYDLRGDGPQGRAEPDNTHE